MRGLSRSGRNRLCFRGGVRAMPHEPEHAGSCGCQRLHLRHSGSTRRVTVRHVAGHGDVRPCAARDAGERRLRRLPQQAISDGEGRSQLSRRPPSAGRSGADLLCGMSRPIRQRICFCRQLPAVPYAGSGPRVRRRKPASPGCPIRDRSRRNSGWQSLTMPVM